MATLSIEKVVKYPYFIHGFVVVFCLVLALILMVLKVMDAILKISIRSQ